MPGGKIYRREKGLKEKWLRLQRGEKTREDAADHKYKWREAPASDARTV
jgi:hypothetical protein